MELKFKQIWRWPKDLEDFITERAEGYVVHVCAGESRLGDLRIDKYTDVEVNGDMFDIPLDADLADTTVCDPPFNVGYHRRHYLHWELRRITKVGGRILFKAPWIFHAKGVENQEYWLLVPTHVTENVSILTVGRKVQATLG